MYRLIIVDDEWETLRGMRDTLPWNQWGFEVVEIASSGEEAWKLVQKIVPDVILTDIRMEEMSGIRLIDFVHQKFPKIRSVIISGYSDIEYYRKALEYKVFDYILKPSREEDFKKIFTNLRETLDEQRSKEEKYQYFKEHWDKNKETLQEKFFSDLLDDIYHSHTEIMKQAEEYGIDLPSRIRIIEADWNREKHNIVHAKAIRQCMENHLKCIRGFLFENKNQKITIVCSDEVNEAYLEQMFREMHREVWAQWGISLCFGISSEIELINGGVALKEADVALHQMIFSETDYIFSFQDLTFDEVCMNVKAPVEQVVNAVFFNGEVDWKRELDQFFNLFKRKNIYDYSHLDFFCVQVFLEIIRYAEKQGIAINTAGSRTEFADEMSKIQTLGGKQALLTEKICQVADSIQGTEVRSRLVRDIERIIKENYADAGMSLNYIAEKTGRSVNYLSAIYKNETGTNINDEIIQHRMEKAKRLVAEGQLKMYKIAEAIGYTDSSYFAKIFKRYTGLSPANYREMAAEKKAGKLYD